MFALQSVQKTIQQQIALTDVKTQVEKLAKLLDKDENKMVIGGDVNAISAKSVLVTRQAITTGLLNTLDETQVIDLENMDIDPAYTQQILIERFEREGTQLNLMNGHLSNLMRNTKTYMSACQIRNENLKVIKEGLDESLAIQATDKQKLGLVKLQQIFSQVKKDMILESAEKESSNEDDHWRKLPEDISVNALMVLLLSKVVVQHPKDITLFKLAVLD